jgi:hypothetical protein
MEMGEISLLSMVGGALAKFWIPELLVVVRPAAQSGSARP